MDLLNNFLDRVTMYKLVLWSLRVLFGVTLVLGFLKIIPFDPISQAVSFSIIWISCVVSNYLLSKIFRAPTNSESVFITALILFFILTPTTNHESLLLHAVAGLIAMASKYILAIGKKHIFNPAAFGVVFSGLVLNHQASWWVGDINLLPFLLLIGFLIVKKTQRFSLVLSYMGVTMLFVFLGPHSNFSSSYIQSVIRNNLPFLIYFSSIMLTEPLTSPTRRHLQVIYAVIVALLQNISTVVPTPILAMIYPETALLIGNAFAFIVNPRFKMFLTLSSKTSLSSNVLNFDFPKPKNFSFIPGQYLEWTLPHSKMDFRGNRRYFTIASSPTENQIKLGIKFYDHPSSFKRSLNDMRDGDKIVAGQLSGDFLIPNDLSKKYIFIAGGIGITPFRSMLKYLLDKSEKRNITLFYSNKDTSEIVYKDILDQAHKKLGIKTIYNLTEERSIPKDWTGKVGRVSPEMIKEVAGYKDSIYYLSGPHAMVSGFEKTLSEIGIPRSHIKKDFFPGFV